MLYREYLFNHEKSFQKQLYFLEFEVIIIITVIIITTIIITKTTSFRKYILYLLAIDNWM